MFNGNIYNQTPIVVLGVVVWFKSKLLRSRPADLKVGLRLNEPSAGKGKVVFHIYEKKFNISFFTFLFTLTLYPCLCMCK